MKVIISFVVGALLTISILSIILWVFRVEILNVLSGPYGVKHVNTVEVLQEDMFLFQDGKEVGFIKKGSKILHIANHEIMEYRINFGWEPKQPHEQYFQVDESSEPFSAFTYMTIRNREKGYHLGVLDHGRKFHEV